MLARPVTAALGLLAFCTSAVAQDQAATEDPVVAVVNGKEIQRTAVENVARSLPEQMQQVPMEQLYPMLLDRVIDFQLISEQAEEQNLGEDPDVQPALEEARAAVLRDHLLQQMIDEGVTEEKVQARYEEMKADEGFSSEEVKARHILLENEDDAKAVITELEGGADFETLAKERSTGPSAQSGGDLGYFTTDQMVPEFGEAAFSMEVGSTSSAPVETQFGWHVIKVEDKRQVEPTLEESEPQIRQELARDIVTVKVEELREGAKIERFSMDGSPMPEGAPEGGGEAPDAASETPDAASEAPDAESPDAETPDAEEETGDGQDGG